jgi:hypothetical protein
MRGGIVLARRDQGLQQGREDRVQRQSALQTLGKMPFDRQGMTMAEQSGIRDEPGTQRHNRVGMVIPVVPAVGGDRHLVEKLARHVGGHPADAGDYLVAEHRMLIVGQKMPQDRTIGADLGIARGKILAQQLLEIRTGNSGDRCFDHGPALYRQG